MFGEQFFRLGRIGSRREKWCIGVLLVRAGCSGSAVWGTNYSTIGVCSDVLLRILSQQADFYWRVIWVLIFSWGVGQICPLCKPTFCSRGGHRNILLRDIQNLSLLRWCVCVKIFLRYRHHVRSRHVIVFEGRKDLPFWEWLNYHTC